MCFLHLPECLLRKEFIDYLKTYQELDVYQFCLDQSNSTEAAPELITIIIEEKKKDPEVEDTSPISTHV